jgi:hypothetical protein
MLEKTPYEILNGRKPNIAYFRVFGCKFYILKKGTRLRKFEKKYDEGFLLGYSTTSKAYKVWNLHWLVVLLRKFMMWNLMKPMVPKRKMII